MTGFDRRLLDADDWFGGLPAERRDLLLSQAHVRAFEVGGRIYSVDDEPNGLWAVLDGEVRLKGYPAAGLEFLALILRPGAWFGETSTLDDGPRPHDAVAVSPSRLLNVPMGTFRRLVAEAPLLYLDVARLLCRHQRFALDFIGETVALPLDVRLAKLLLNRSRTMSDGLELRQDELAVMLSVSRQTLNGRLRRLAEVGVIRLGYGRIEVLNPARLQAMAQAPAD